jgi:poly(3-hydroxybutyrate) depolymerase
MRHRLAFAALAFATACSSSPHEQGPDAPPEPMCTAARGTLHSQVLTKGDGVQDRYYWLHVPSSYDCTAIPMLVDFHGTATDQPVPPEEAYQTDALIAFSEANGVIVARPRSRSSVFGGVNMYRWDENPGDLGLNVKYADNLVAALEMTYAIDPARVYASGFSTGSNMVAQFLADPSSPFHGIAPIAGGNWAGTPFPNLSNGPRVWMSTGYRDYLWPYARGMLAQLAAAGLPAERVELRHTGGGHDLYPWHFDELWQFLDGGTHHGGGALAAPWTASTLPSPADVNAIVDDAGMLLAAGAKGRTWRLGAQGWTLELDRGDADYTALCLDGKGHALVGGDNTIAVYGTLGWSAASSVPDYGMLGGAGWVNGATYRADGSLVVVGYWSAALSKDNGATWSKFDTPSIYPGVEAQSAVIATASDGVTLAAGYYDYLALGAPGAATAMPIPHPNPVEWWNAIATAPGGKVWVVGDGGAIIATSDGGATWTAQASGTTENLYAVHFADALHGAAAGRRGTVVTTADGGAHWTSRPTGIDGYIGAVHVDATTIWIAGEGGLVASSASP